MDRDRIIIRTSIIGIIANVFLASFKALIGLLSNSIAIVLDAVNNLSDVLSSVITIIGTKLASKEPDKDHPLGHGRAEYLSTIVIAVLVSYAGIASLIESVKKIAEPRTPDYKPVGLVIIAVAVAVKILLGLYVKKTGKQLNAHTLIASGQDALLDSVISASTLVAALIFVFFHISLEAWLGAVISLIIIKSGYEMINEAISNILGKRVEMELAKSLKQEICACSDDIYGAYDLVLHDYGPNRMIGSVHIEIPHDYTAEKIDALTRRVQRKIYEKFGVVLAGVSIYAKNSSDNDVVQAEQRIRQMISEKEYVLQMHGFFLDKEEMRIVFDVIVDFDAPDAEAVLRGVREMVQVAYPGYQIEITLDRDTSD